MSREIDNWLRRAKRLLKDMPRDVEVHVGYNSLTVYPKGRMNQHMGSIENGFGIPSDGTMIDEIETDGRLIPYSEGS